MSKPAAPGLPLKQHTVREMFAEPRMQVTDQQWTQCDICKGKLSPSDLQYLRGGSTDSSDESSPEGIRTISKPELVCGVCRSGATVRNRKRTSPLDAVPLRGVGAFLFCALAGTTLVTALAMFLFDSRSESEDLKREVLEALPETQVFSSPSSAPIHSPPPGKVQTKAKVESQTPKPAPKARRPLAATLRVSASKPKKGRGIRITLSLPSGEVPKSSPELRLRDSRGAAYRSLMQPGGKTGEWVWASGLDVAGRWRGAAYARCGDRTLSANLPPVTVVP